MKNEDSEPIQKHHLTKEGTVSLKPEQDPRLKDPLPERVYHIAVWGLVGITGISVIGIILLSIFGKTTSEGLISIASACVGGLVGIFAQRSSTN
ncbi:hypothetical protein [Methylocucumis oryzae]|nr:hypothetical protein [Methylocucumis oryzae]